MNRIEGRQEQNRVFLLQGFCLLCAAIALLIIVYNYRALGDGYGLIILFPVAYAIAFVATIRSFIACRYMITCLIFTVIEAIRFILMPAAIALAGANCGSPSFLVTPQYIQYACIAMLIELVVCYVVLAIVARRCKRDTRFQGRAVWLAGSKMLYALFIILGLSIFLYYHYNGYDLVQFLVIRAGTGERIGDLSDSFLTLARQIVLLSCIFAFLCVVSFCKRKYAENRTKSFFYLLALASGLFNVCLIVGERRTAQVYTAFCVCYILYLVFRERRKTTFRIIIGAAVIIVALMSVYKVSYAFLYGSYAEALASTSFSMEDAAIMLQSYFAGPHNNAAFMMYVDTVQSPGLGGVLFDFCRSVFPVSFLFKGFGDTTSVFYNNFVYSGAQDSGHILFTTGYSYAFGGLAFSFWCMLLNIVIALFCEHQMKKTHSIEMAYIWAYMLFRFTVNMTMNTPALLSSALIMFVSAGLLVIVAKLMAVNRNGTMLGEKRPELIEVNAARNCPAPIR